MEDKSPLPQVGQITHPKSAEPTTIIPEGNKPIYNSIKPVNKGRLFICLGIFMVVAVAILLMLSSIGLASQSYDYVLWIEGIARWVGYAMAAATGFVLARLVAGETFKKPPVGPGMKILRILLLLAAFVGGTIPGFIVYGVLAWPLSSHSCRLSGSKYC